MLVWTWFACGALAPGERDAFLDAHERLIRLVEVHADEVESLVRHGKGDGDYVYAGTLYPASGEAWTGAVDVEGTGTVQQGGTRQAWSLTLTYDDVEIRDVQMNGTVDATLSLTIDQTIAISDVLRGTLDLDGDARAEGLAFDYGMVVTSEDPVRRFTGEIDGREIDVALE